MELKIKFQIDWLKKISDDYKKYFNLLNYFKNIFKNEYSFNK